MKWEEAKAALWEPDRKLFERTLFHHIFWGFWLAVLLGQLVADAPYRLPFPFWMDTKIDNHVISEVLWLLCPAIVKIKTKSAVKAILTYPMILSIHEGLWFWFEAFYNHSGLLGTSLWPYESLALAWTGALAYLVMDKKLPAKLFLWLLPFYAFWGFIGFPTILGFGQSYVAATTPWWIHAIEIESWSMMPLGTWLFAHE